jgi:hypothetical protein
VIVFAIFVVAVLGLSAAVMISRGSQVKGSIALLISLVLSTVGMCGQRMPTLDRYMADTSHHARVELALATTLPAHHAARIFRWIGAFPWRAVTWFGTGHTVKWLDNPEDRAMRRGAGAVLLGEVDDQAVAVRGVGELDAGRLQHLRGLRPVDLELDLCLGGGTGPQLELTGF